VDGNANSQFAQLTEQLGVERRHRLRLQRQGRFTAVTRLYEEAVVEEIKGEVESPITLGDGGSREAPRGHVKRNVPGVVDPRRLREADLPYDLSPPMERGVGVFPCLNR
jgi:hypothetical protein